MPTKEDLLNPNSSYYSSNQLRFRPDESQSQYLSRTSALTSPPTNPTNPTPSTGGNPTTTPNITEPWMRTATGIEPNPYYSRIPSGAASNPIPTPAGYNTAANIVNTVETPQQIEDRIRNEQMKIAENRIQGVYNRYKPVYARAEEQGQKDLAGTNAISAITGLMGSGSAVERQRKSAGRTEKQKQAIDDVVSSEIAAIYGKMDENVALQKSAELETNRKNAEALYKRVADNALGLLQSTAASGKGLTFDQFKSVNDSTLQAVIGQTGKSEYELRQLWDSSIPQEYKPIKHTVYLADGKGGTIMKQISFDPVSGKTTEKEYNVPDVESSYFTGEKPIEVDGKLLVKGPDGKYIDVAPHTAEELAAKELDMDYKKSQIAVNYANAAKIRADDEKVPTVKTINGVDMQWDPKSRQWETIGGGKNAPTQKTLDQVSFLKDTAKQAIDLSGASGRSGARKTGEAWFVGSTDYTRLESVANTLKVNVLALMTDPNIKKFFGPQMSNADVTLMTSAGTTLNPELNSPEQMKTEIERLQGLFDRMESALKSGASGEGTTLIIGPDGNQWNVPNENVEQSLKDGGRRP